MDLLGWFARLPRLLQVLGALAGYMLSTFSGELPHGLQKAGLWIGYGIGTAFLIGLALHLLKDWRGKDKVEPVDLVMLGLGGMVLAAGLVLGGLVWQQIATPKQPPLTQQPTPGSDTVNVLPIKPIRHYSARDKDQISDAVSELSQLLNQDVSPLFEGGHAILRDFHKDKNFDAAITALKRREAIISSINERLDEILTKKYRNYKDVLDGVLRMNPERQLSKALTSGMDYRQKLETAKAISAEAPQTKEQAIQMIDPQDSFFGHANTELKTWVEGFNQRAETIKADILSEVQVADVTPPSPRRLSESQKTALADTLKNSDWQPDSVWIRYFNVGDECRRYASDLRAALTLAGWNGDFGQTADQREDLLGLKLHVDDLDAKPRTAVLLALALEKASIDFEWSPWPGIGKDRTILFAYPQRD